MEEELWELLIFLEELNMMEKMQYELFILSEKNLLFDINSLFIWVYFELCTEVNIFIELFWNFQGSSCSK